MPFIEVTLPEEDFYRYWQNHKTAIVLDSRDNEKLEAIEKIQTEQVKQFDTCIIKCDSMKWKDMPIHKTISFIQQLNIYTLIIHLKK